MCIYLVHSFQLKVKQNKSRYHGEVGSEREVVTNEHNLLQQKTKQSKSFFKITIQLTRFQK